MVPGPTVCDLFSDVFFNCVCLCLRVHVCVHVRALMHAYALASVGTCRGRKRISDPLEPGSQVWVLGTKSTESSLLPQHVVFDLCRARRPRLNEAPVWAMRGCSHYTIGHAGCLVILSSVIASPGRFTLSQQDSFSLTRVF